MLEKLSEAHNAIEAINNDETVLEVVRWGLGVIREGGEATKEVQARVIQVVTQIVKILRVQPHIVNMLPGLSSVATKVLGGDFKTGTKVKLSFIALWLEDVLPRYLATQTTNPPTPSKVSLISSLLITK